MLAHKSHLNIEIMNDVNILVINHGFKNVLEATIFSGSKRYSLSSKETIDQEPWGEPQHALKSGNTTNSTRIVRWLSYKEEL